MKRHHRISWGICLSIIWLGGRSLLAAPTGFIDASTYGGGYNSIDATAALQAAIDTGQNVYVPNMGAPWTVTPIFLTQSNQQIVFESGVVVQAKEGAFKDNKDDLFRSTKTSNVKLIGYGATLQMRREDYTDPLSYDPGEWRHGIRLDSVNNFVIEGLTIKDTGGDGILVNAAHSNDYSENVLIKDVVLDNNYRQGISVISAKNLTIDNAVILSTNGTPPQAGIDFEPDHAGHVLEGITVRNSIIMGNQGNGIQFALGLMADPGQVTATFKNLTIVGNDETGFRIYTEQPLAGITVQDSIFMNHRGYGFTGAGIGQTDFSGLPEYVVDDSAFWGNAGGVTGGWASLGEGSLTNVKPLFYSLDPNDPWFMYLATNVSAAISQGGENGSYMGARPLYGTLIPEPTAAGAVVGAGFAFLARRRRPVSRP